jgi:hypothetical protein
MRPHVRRDAVQISPHCSEATASSSLPGSSIVRSIAAVAEVDDAAGELAAGSRPSPAPTSRRAIVSIGRCGRESDALRPVLGQGVETLER